MLNPKDFFESHINIDIKIKVLNEFDYETVVFLSSINDNIKQIYNTQKFWRYRIYNFIHRKFSNTEQSIEKWIKFYEKNVLCCYQSYPNICCKIERNSHDNPYCFMHSCIKKINYSQCEYRIDRVKHGIICGKPISDNIEKPYCNGCTKKRAIQNSETKRYNYSIKYICGYEYEKDKYCGKHIYTQNKLNYCFKHLKQHVQK
jgi:hypothetical protein